MKKRNMRLIWLALVMLGIFSCNKVLIPTSVVGKQGKNYDSAAFNYVYVEAIKQKLMGSGGDALKYFEQCIKLNPVSDAAYYQMAQIVISNGDLNNGKYYATKAYSIDSENVWYLMMLAGIYYQEKNLDSAIIFYEKAVKYYPEKLNLQLNLGNLYAENKRFDMAKEIFDSLDKKFDVNESITLSSVKSLMDAGNYEEALVKINVLLKEYPDEILYYGILAEIYKGKGESNKAMDLYTQLMEKNPEDAQTQLSLCDFLIAEKSYNELFMLLNSVILNSRVSRDQKVALFARLLEVTDLNLNQKNELMLSVLVLEANYKEDDIISLFRPELLIKQGHISEAAERLEEIIKINAKNYFAWEKLLLVYLQMKEYDILFTRAEECATLFNRSFLAKILCANAAIETERYTIALEELRKAEILAGENVEYLVQVLTMRADIFYRTKEYLKAFEIFEQALNYNKEDITILNNYAYYLAEQNLRLKEAEIMAKRVIEKEKSNNTYLDTYGWVLYKRGKLKEAAKVMESIISSGEKPDAEWFEHYGFILKKQRKCTKAIENWNIAIKIDSTKTNLIKEINNCAK